MDAHDSASSGRFKPQGELAIYTAAALKSELFGLMDQCRQLEIDLSEVTEMDSAGLQLLLLARREAAQRQIGLQISGCGPAVMEVLELCGLTAHLCNGDGDAGPGVN